jgi:hypothetical protein
MEYVMNPVKTLLLASTMIATSALAAHADVKVVTSIKPVHSLVASVMQGVGEPSLIVDGAASPHNYALKPSQAQMLEQADVVFWVGHELEAFLEKPLETVGAKAKSVELIDAHDLVKLGYREGGAFETHGHDDEAAHDGHVTIMTTTRRPRPNTITTRRPIMTTTMTTARRPRPKPSMITTTTMTTARRPRQAMTMGMTMANLISTYGLIR